MTPAKQADRNRLASTLDDDTYLAHLQFLMETARTGAKTIEITDVEWRRLSLMGRTWSTQDSTTSTKIHRMDRKFLDDILSGARHRLSRAQLSPEDHTACHQQDQDTRLATMEVDDLFGRDRASYILTEEAAMALQAAGLDEKIIAGIQGHAERHLARNFGPETTTLCVEIAPRRPRP